MDTDPEPATLQRFPLESSPSKVPILTTIFLILAIAVLSSPANAQLAQTSRFFQTPADLQTVAVQSPEIPLDRNLQKADLLGAGLQPQGPSADEYMGPPPKEHGNVWPTPPFDAWSAVPNYVRKDPKMSARLTGVLQRGDTVKVTACIPDCKSAKAWAILGFDGAVPLRTLKAMPVASDAFGTSAAVRYEYGFVPGGRPAVYAKPDLHAHILRHEKSEFRLAFVPNPQMALAGWLQRPDGGWMRKRDIKLFTPSKFEGVHDGSQEAFVFVRRQVVLKTPNDPPKIRKPTKEQQLARAEWLKAHTLHRYDHLTYLGEKNGRVLVPGGTLPRDVVRVVRQVARPKGIAATDAWIHVDLREQVLTAYEGDRRVMATLVSTGKDDLKSHKTHPGTFKVYAKSVHTSMRGKPWDDYFAEEVPWTMHYDDGRALHGAYWHDQFGIQKSHGCINLSPADAAWLFQWIPPHLPEGWHSVLAVSAKLPTAWVVVEKPGEVVPAKQGHSVAHLDPGLNPQPR